MVKRSNLLHWGIIAAGIGSFGISFDAWWHISKGRDSFFVLPHLFIHLGVLSLLVISYYGWKKFGEREWRKVFWWIFLVPLSLPFDEIWHYFRGKESIESIMILWSPPHIMLFVGAIGGLFSISLLIKKEKSMVAREFFGSLLIASLLNVVFIITGPFFAFSPHAIMGYYGTIVSTFVLIYLFIHAHRVLPSAFPAVLVAMFSSILQMIFFDSNVVFGSRAVGTYPHIPNWLLVLSLITPAALIDFLPRRRLWLEGAGAGLIFGIILYWLAFQYLDPSSNPGPTHITIGVVSSLVGGLLAGIAHSIKTNRDII